jgi:hypothetical protein
MDSPLSNSTLTTAKGFWKTKDGKWGLMFLIPIVALSLWGLSAILPFLITLTTNIITLIGLVIALLGIVYVATDKQIRTTVFYAYKILIKSLRRLIVNSNPVAVLQVYIDRLNKKYETVKEQIRQLYGATQKLDDSIQRAQADMQEQLQMMAAAKRKDPKDISIGVYANQAGRDEKDIKDFQAMLTKLNSLKKFLTEMSKACQVVIADKTNEVKSITIKQEVMGRAWNAFASAWSVLKGDPDERAFFEEAMESIQSDISYKSGMIDSFIDESSDVLKDISLQNSAFEEKGNALLERWQKEGIPALLTDGSEKVNPLQQINAVPARYEVVDAAKESGKSNKYSNLVK